MRWPTATSSVAAQSVRTIYYFRDDIGRTRDPRGHDMSKVLMVVKALLAQLTGVPAASGSR